MNFAQAQASQWPAFLKMDVRKYFDSIDHTVLLTQLYRLIKDRRVLELFEKIISHYGARGLPIGSLTSQHLANLYLSRIDHFALECLRVRGYARYMDDIAVWGSGCAELRSIRLALTEELSSLKLVPKPTPFINHSRHGMNWLGYRVFSDRVTLSQRSRVQLSLDSVGKP